MTAFSESDSPDLAVDGRDYEWCGAAFVPSEDWADWLCKPLSPVFEASHASGLGSPMMRRLVHFAGARLGPNDGEDAYYQMIEEVADSRSRSPNWGFPLPDPDHIFADHDEDYSAVSGYLFFTLQRKIWRRWKHLRREQAVENIDVWVDAGGLVPPDTLGRLRPWRDVLSHTRDVFETSAHSASTSLFDRPTDRRAALAYIDLLVEFASGQLDPADAHALVQRFRLDGPASTEHRSARSQGRGADDDYEIDELARDLGIFEDDPLVDRPEGLAVAPSSAEHPGPWVERLTIPTVIAEIYWQDRRVVDPGYRRPNAADDFDRAFNAAFWRVVAIDSMSSPSEKDVMAAWLTITRVEPATRADELVTIERTQALREILRRHHARTMEPSARGGGAYPRPQRMTDETRRLFRPIAVGESEEQVFADGDMLALARKLAWRALLISRQADHRFQPPTAFWRGAR